MSCIRQQFKKATLLDDAATQNPLLNPLGETTSHSTKQANSASKLLVIPQAGEEAIVKDLF